MSKRILWMDNDTPYLRPYVKALQKRGYEAKVVASLSEAEALLNSESFDLVIIDVMVPTQTDAEASEYPYVSTDYGHKTGLTFYNRIKKLLGDKLPTIAVMTVRLDQDIRDEFAQSGLSSDHFVTKYNVREASSFIQKIESIMADIPTRTGVGTGVK